MKKVKIFFTALLVLVTSAAFAQSREVTGRITDAETGEGIPFASIQIKGKMIGTSADADGNYSIKIQNEDAALVFVSVGYKTEEAVVAGRGRVDVALHVDAAVLDETIVIAFGTATKESFTGSATVVKSSDIAKVQSSDATRALEGVVAGVQMTTASGALGSSPSIRIRGISSISAGSAPLYVVDGVPYPGDINNINPSDIESMTVLKDAASNALYGARGANGVIMITTKKAKRGNAVVNVDAKWGANTKALLTYDYITDPGQYYETHYNALKNYYMSNGISEADAHLRAATNVAGSSREGGLGYNVYEVPEGQLLIGSNGRINPAATLGRHVNYNGQDYLLQPDNWLDNVYKATLRQEYNVSVSAGNEKASFYASLGMLDNKGIVEGQAMRRYTAKLRADYQAKSWLKVGANMSYTNFTWENANPNEDAGSTGSTFGMAIGMAPIYPLFIRDGQGNIMKDVNGYNRYDFGNGQNAGLTRPNATNANALCTNLLDLSVSNGNAFNGTGFIDVKFLKDFTLTINGGVGLDETRSKSMSNPYYGQFVPNGGNISVAHGRTFFMNFQQILSWNRKFGEHSIDAIIGHEYYRQDSYSLQASKTKLFSTTNLELNGAVVDAASSASSHDWYNNEGFFTRVQYDYADKIYASASYRRDASSRFHPDHRWGNFWSVGAGWLIDREPWFNASWIDMLKIKASIGSQGNDNIGNYLYTDKYSITNSEGEVGVTFSSKGNENITWETNTNFNVGVDFDFFKGRLSGSVEYFYRKTSDMLFFFTVPASLGYDGYYDNIGDMRNAGIEFALNGDIMRRKNFVWSANLNATHYTNKIISLPEERKIVTMEGYEGYASGTYFYGEGLPLYTRKMPKYAGIDRNTGEPMWYRDVTGEDGIVRRETTKDYSSATEYLCGAPTPKLYGGFGTSFSFYGVDISVQFTYQLGGQSYDSGYAQSLNAPGTKLGENIHKDVLTNSWTPSNRDASLPRFQYMDKDFNSTSDRFLTDASYLNFQNAQIGYTFPAKLTNKIKISRLRIYAAADNIWYVSARRGFDPRYSFSGSTSYTTNSTVRTISGGINITF